jgi:hypothetical protein
LDNELWQPGQGYEGYYEVNTCGVIRGIDRLANLPDGRKRRIKGRILATKRNNDNYLFVSLSKDGITKTKYIHRAVAEAFIPNPWGLPEVNHLDGNKENNAIANLQWCTHQQNVQHAYDTGLSSNKGGTHPFAVRIIDNVLNMVFATEKEWCVARGINYSTGRNILKGQKSRTISLKDIVKIK